MILFQVTTPRKVLEMRDIVISHPDSENKRKCTLYLNQTTTLEAIKNRTRKRKYFSLYSISIFLNKTASHEAVLLINIWSSVVAALELKSPVVYLVGFVISGRKCRVLRKFKWSSTRLEFTFVILIFISPVEIIIFLCNSQWLSIYSRAKIKFSTLSVCGL